MGCKCPGYASLSAQAKEVHSSNVKSLSMSYHTEALSCAVADTAITPPFDLGTTQAFLLFDSEDQQSTEAESCHLSDPI